MNGNNRYRIRDISIVKQLGLIVNPNNRYRLNKKQEAEYKSIINNKIDDLEDAKKRNFDSSKKRFIITWAQSETDIHNEAWKNLKVYAKSIKAEILVICGRYANPTSLNKSKAIESNEKSKNLWHKELRPYLYASRQNIHEYLCVLADVKVQPTAITPLSGFNGITALESCIIGHPHLHFKSLPILPSYPHKVLLTTGAITLPNYTDTKSGKKGEFHHTLGFAIVELDGEHFHVRQVQFNKDGSFYDLDKYVNGEVIQSNNYPAIVLGDLHLGVENKDLIDKTFNLIDNIKFDKIILHDVFDGSSINHHELKNPFLLLDKENDGKLSLGSELEYILSWFRNRSKYNFVSIMSNHNDFVDRWLMNSDWRVIPNKELYLRLAMLKVKNMNKSIINLLLSDFKNVTCYEYGESFRMLGFELGLHGDKGANGSRGSANQFRDLNTRTITAHSHTPSRQLGSIIVGTSTHLNLGYNIGLCSWMNTHAIIYPNGKASLINFINGKFSTMV